MIFITYSILVVKSFSSLAPLANGQEIPDLALVTIVGVGSFGYSPYPLVRWLVCHLVRVR